MAISLEAICGASAHECVFVCGLAPSHLPHERYALFGCETVLNKVLAALDGADRVARLIYFAGFSCAASPLRVLVASFVFEHFKVDISIFFTCGYAFGFFARRRLARWSYRLQLVIEIVQILLINDAMFFLVSHLGQNFFFDTLRPKSIESWVRRHNWI